MILDCELYLLSTPVAGRKYGISELEALMDEAGIDRAIAMPDVVYKPDNLGLAEQLRAQPRFLPCALVNPNLGKEAIEELEIGVSEWGICGVKLMPTKHAYPIVSKLVRPVIARCAELKIPVSVHSEAGWAHPLGIASLAADYPDVPFIMDHMGYRYWVQEAIAGARQNPNVYLATTAVMEPHYIAAAIDEVGVDRIVFGSNAPFVIPRMQVEVIKYLRLAPEEEAKIFGETLAKLYHLESESAEKDQA